jgi:fatty acid/phospholipid biosynthesis enzyme
MPITKLEQIIDTVKSRPKKRLVAAWATDSHTVSAVAQAVELGLVDATLVGDEPTIRKVCQSEGLDAGRFAIVHEPDEIGATRRAVALINAGEGQILMKGLVSSDKYMRAILDKEKGLMDAGAILSHVTVIEVARYPKLIVCGDVAVLPAPELKEKIAITRYKIAVAHALGIERPKVGLLSIGTERSKGNELTQKAYELLEGAPLNFIGNVEGTQMFTAEVDVTVCDGFVGNVVLKVAEGAGQEILSDLKAAFQRNWLSKLGAWLLLPSLRGLAAKYDYAEYGGALLLGVNGVCVVAHGKSDARAVAKAIMVGAQAVEGQVQQHLVDTFGKLRPTPQAAAQT